MNNAHILTPYYFALYPLLHTLVDIIDIANQELVGIHNDSGLPAIRDSGIDFVRFSVPFLEDQISDIRAACKSHFKT